MDIYGEVYGMYCACSTCEEKYPQEIRYVGVTIEGVEKRARSHFNEARRGKSQKAKDRWIRKHGEHNIRFSVLESGVRSIEDLRIAEVAWISKLATFGGPRGLNMTRGGEGVWGYRFKEETKEAFRNRTAEQFSVKHPRSKLTRSDVENIIERIWSGETAREIARNYSVSSSTIQKIRTGQNWPQIPRPSTPPPPVIRTEGAPRLSRETRESIWESYSGEWGDLKRIAEKFNVCETTVSLIVNGHRDLPAKLV